MHRTGWNEWVGRDSGCEGTHARKVRSSKPNHPGQQAQAPSPRCPAPASPHLLALEEALLQHGVVGEALALLRLLARNHAVLRRLEGKAVVGWLVALGSTRRSGATIRLPEPAQPPQRS